MPTLRPVQRGIAALVVVVVALTAGCSRGEGNAIDPANPYAAEFEQALASASSDFERAVLADGQITAEEWQEAQQKEVSCLTDHGITAWYDTDPLGDSLNFPSIGGEAPDESVLSDCARGTTRQIQSLYEAVRINPAHEDPDDLIAACLRRHGLAPEGFTGQDLKVIWDSLPVYSGDHSAPPDDTPLMVPGGGDIRSDEGARCVAAPQL